MKMTRFIPVIALGLALQSVAFADTMPDLASFSAFKEVDLSKMAGGEIMASRGQPLGFPRGLSVQFCYVIPAPLQKAEELQQRWNGTKHSELKAYLHGDLSSKPTLDDFKRVASAPDIGPVRSLVAATQKLDAAAQPPIQMSREEAKLFKPDPASHSGVMPQPVVSFWQNLLQHRAAAFATGGIAKQPPYDTGGGSVTVQDEVGRLLKEQPKIRGQFSPFNEILSGGAPSGSQLYWELFDVEGTATFSLGAFYAKPSGEGWQALDLHYYASDGYYVLLTFYQMWPVKIGSQQATLVWRCDLLSAPSLSELHGVERIASANAMSKEIQKTIAIFIKDVGTK
jgi:hypothetical protein